MSPISTLSLSLGDVTGALSTGYKDVKGGVSSAAGTVGGGLHTGVSGLENGLDKAKQAAQEQINKLNSELNDADNDLKKAQTALDEAKSLGDSALDKANKTLSDAVKLGNQAIQASRAAYEDADRVTQQAISGATAGLKQVQNGPLASALQTAQQTAKNFEAVSKAGLAAAQKNINDLAHSAEYLEAQAAKMALDAANATLTGLQAVGSFADIVGQDLERAGKVAIWIATHLDDLLFDIESVSLSAKLSGITKGNEPFTIAVKAQALCKDVDLSLTYDPRQTKQFILDLFKSLWHAIV